MASFFAPINSTPSFSRRPEFSKEMAAFNAVWPPIVGSSASGFSFFIIASKLSKVIGSTYVESAISGSVIIVAGLEFTKTTR